MVKAGRRGIGGTFVPAVAHDKETADADSDFAVGRLCSRTGFGDDYCQVNGSFSGSDYVVGSKVCDYSDCHEVSNAVGGIPSLTAAVVIVVGLFGAICGFKLLQVGRVASPIAQGLSMGTASHAVGTSRAMEVSGKYGAYASLGLTLNGILTALLSPTILHILGLY